MYEALFVAAHCSMKENERKTKAKQAKIALMKETLSPEEFKQWEKDETEERRHQEVCQAIRATKPDPVTSDCSGAGLFGLAVGLSI